MVAPVPELPEQGGKTYIVMKEDREEEVRGQSKDNRDMFVELEYRGREFAERASAAKLSARRGDLRHDGRSRFRVEGGPISQVLDQEAIEAEEQDVLDARMRADFAEYLFQGRHSRGTPEESGEVRYSAGKPERPT